MAIESLPMSGCSQGNEPQQKWWKNPWLKFPMLAAVVEVQNIGINSFKKTFSERNSVDNGLQMLLSMGTKQQLPIYVIGKNGTAALVSI